MTETSNTHILVVEDDPHLLAGICDILELVDYKVMTANNGVEALKVLRDTKTLPALIVSDIMMPEMDGYDLLHAVRREHEWVEIPFIFLTARTQHTDQREGIVAGADDYLAKPFKADDLLNAIKAKLKRREQINNMQLWRIQHIKRDILTIISHEFRTPLTPVVAYSDLVSTDIDTLSQGELKYFISAIRTGADRLRRLVDDLLLLVELETGEASRHHQSYREKFSSRHLSALLRDVIEEFSPRALDKHITLALAHPVPADMPAFWGSPDYVRAAMVRLLDNAIKFSNTVDQAPQKDLKIQIDVHVVDKQVVIDVCDEGRGIPRSQFEQIFESFYQINRERYEDQGSGAGLAIVKAIMEMHGGQVSVASEVGKGSTFTLSFPML